MIVVASDGGDGHDGDQIISNFKKIKFRTYLT